MSFVAHVQKASRRGGETKQGNKMLALGDLYRHNERIGAYGQAKNINPTQTRNNYTLDDYEDTVTYEDRLDAIRERHGILSKERAAAVAAFVISASNEEMAAMDADTQRKFFEDVRDKLGEHFGEGTLVYANVHNDEETPHMHIGFVPTDTTNGKTAIRWGDIQKDKETGEQIERGKVHRNFLDYLQNDLPQELIEKGYKIEIGGKKSTRHIDTAEWRELEEKRKELDDKAEKLEEREGKVRTLESDTKAAAAKLKADKEQQEQVSAAREAALAKKAKEQEAAQKDLEAQQKLQEQVEENFRKFREKREKELKAQEAAHKAKAAELASKEADLNSKQAKWDSGAQERSEWQTRMDELKAEKEDREKYLKHLDAREAYLKELDARIYEHSEEVAKDVMALTDREDELKLTEAILETREENADTKEKRTAKVLNAVSRAVGLDETAHAKFVKSSYANIMKDILMKRINERAKEEVKWQRAAEIGNTIEKGKEAGDNIISLYIAGKRDVTPIDAAVLGMAAHADFKKRMATAPNAIKDMELQYAVQGAKFTDAEAEYNAMLNLLDEKDKEKAEKYVKDKAEERANARRQQAANTSLRSAPKKAAEKAPDLGRSR